MAKRLYVGNISWNTTEEQLKECFAKCGEVTNVNIIKDKESGRSRGFAFIDIENTEKAITELNGVEFMGRVLTVNEAREKEKRKY